MSDFINLSKGEVINLSKMPSIDLSKGGKGLHRVLVGLGCDPISEMNNGEKKGFFSKLFGSSSSGLSEDIDCDAFAVRLTNNHIESSDDIVYFGHLSTRDNSIKHTGDNLTGDGDGDDETIIINLEAVTSDSVMIGVNIYQGRRRNQHFGMLQNAYVRIVDMDTNKELCRYTLDDKYNNYVSIIFGELCKNNNEWSFIAKGEAVDANSISEVVHRYE